MKYRRLGSTGLDVSVIGIGTWQFGGEWGKNFEQAEVDAMFDAARETGINLIDTAECYGDHASERLIGAAIERDRDRWVVCTKFGHKFHGFAERTEPRTPADVVEQTETSLRALRTDRIDVHQYHSWGDAQFFDDDVHATLLKLIDQGKVRHLGNSVGSNVNVTQVGASAARGVEVIQLIYNRLDRKPEQTTLPVCRSQNLGVLARVPLASGLLSGKYGPGHVFPVADVRSKWKGMVEGDDKHRELEAARAEVPEGMEMATWALAWCLRQEAVTAVIPGCKDVTQVLQNAAATGLAPDFDRHTRPMA
jgi:aryl-alcohol dehydrogenase-like predicted oxidoreductase